MAGLGTNVGTAFALRARMNGSLSMGGQSYPIWYFSSDPGGPGEMGFMGDRRLPSSHLELIEGQACSIDFTNQTPMLHTIHLHGLDVDQANDGVPATSYYVIPGGTATYQFVAPHAGTYHYHCHVDTVLHYAMGMYGTVIVRPPGGATDTAWTGGPTFDEEVLWHLHGYDTSWAGLQISGTGTTRWRPDAFFINGKETADALTDPFTKLVVGTGQKAYIRLTNTGYNWARVSMSGASFDVVASDGRPMPAPVRVTEWELGPGERYDLLFSATLAGSSTALVEYLDDITGEVIGSAETSIEVI